MYLAYQRVHLPECDKAVGTGWLPPLPDLRDYTESVKDIPDMVERLGISPGEETELPERTDWREFCSEIEVQGSLGSCTAHAAVGAAEYFQRRAYNEHIDGSRSFIYKVTRDLMGVKGDTGAWIRNTMGALVYGGVPPEKYWPYVIEDFDLDPTPFVYAVAEEYEALKYFCHDPMGQNRPKEEVLDRVKAFLAAGIPSMFGFYGFESFAQTDLLGGIPYPCSGEQAKWGHAVLAVGYDDGLEITNTRCDRSTTGALLIRNSWGTDWGDEGYGWLPYQYLHSGYAQDFWSLISMEWVASKQFGL